MANTTEELGGFATAIPLFAKLLWSLLVILLRKCNALFTVVVVITLQGLNFIAGLMLLVIADEEKVFWLMDTLLNKILPGTLTPYSQGWTIG